MNKSWRGGSSHGSKERLYPPLMASVGREPLCCSWEEALLSLCTHLCGLGATQLEFNLIFINCVSISKCGHILRSWALGLQCMKLVDTVQFTA